MDAAKRYFTGTAVRGYTAAIQSFGLLEQVRKRLPPDTLALVDKPPLATTWIEGRHIDLVLEAVRDLAGEQKVVDVAYRYFSTSLKTILGSLLKATMSLFGASPVVLLSRFDAITGVVLKGVHGICETGGERSLTLTIETVEKASSAWFASQQAVLLYACELCNTAGRLTSFRVEPGGRRAIYKLSWEPKR